MKFESKKDTREYHFEKRDSNLPSVVGEMRFGRQSGSINSGEERNTSFTSDKMTVFSERMQKDQDYQVMGGLYGDPDSFVVFS